MFDKTDENAEHENLDRTEEWIRAIVEDIIKHLDQELFVEGVCNSSNCCPQPYYHMPMACSYNQMPRFYCNNQVYYYEPIKNCACCSNCNNYYNYNNPPHNCRVYTCPGNPHCPNNPNNQNNADTNTQTQPNVNVGSIFHTEPIKPKQHCQRPCPEYDAYQTTYQGNYRYPCRNMYRSLSEHLSEYFGMADVKEDENENENKNEDEIEEENGNEILHELEHIQEEHDGEGEFDDTGTHEFDTSVAAYQPNEEVLIPTSDQFSGTIDSKDSKRRVKKKKSHHSSKFSNK